MLDKSLIISYATPNYQVLTDNFYSSLYQLGMIKQHNISFKLDMVDNNLMKKTGFMTDLFYHCIINKVKNVIDKLNENKNKYKYYISSDLDIWFLQNRNHIWDELESYINKNNKAIYFMREDRTDLINGGFFIIKNEYLDESIKFLEKVYYLLLNTPRNELPFLEQTVINNIKHEIMIDFIPNDYVIWGHMIYNNNKALFHHAVCCNDSENKITQINNIKKIFYKNAPMPNDFNIDVYKIINKFDNWNNDQLKHHWFNHGILEGRPFKLEEGFNFLAYKILNNVPDWDNDKIINHWINHGKNQGWKYKLEDDFDYDAYRNLNNVLDWNNEEIEWHWLNHGRHQNWKYKY